MISLFLDTSYHNTIISIFKGKKELYFYEEENKQDLSEKLLPRLKEIMEGLHLYVTDIEKIYVVNGPGSFTGIRIGLTVAKTIAWSLNIPIVPISELEFLATTKGATYIAPIIDARRNAVYAGLYTSSLQPVIEDGYYRKEEFLQKIKEFEEVTLVSFDAFDGIEVKLPKVNPTKIVEKYASAEGDSVHTLIPNYLKKTEAEEKLNDTTV